MSAAIPREQRASWSGTALGGAIGRLRSGSLAPSGRFTFAAGLLLAVVAVGGVGPYLSGIDDPLKIVGLLYDPPSSNAWLGTDNFGRDVFTQLMYGIRTSLIIGGIAGAVATGIGVLIGTVAGF